MNPGRIEIDKILSVELGHLAKFHLRLEFSEGRKETQEDPIANDKKVYRLFKGWVRSRPPITTKARPATRINQRRYFFHNVRL